jgi:prepilin-type N-terminal cleavage/methylation domain-containing protein
MVISTRSKRRGFTLIETIAAIAIIAILFVFLVPRLIGGQDRVRAGNTKSFLAQLAAQIAEVELEKGDWPRSTPTTGMDLPNKVNVGSELLVVALYAPDRPHPGLPDERLVNTDGDTARKSLTSLPLAALYEIADDWQNPIAYIHRSDYDQPFEYQTIGADGAPWVQTVRARKNPATGDYYEPMRFQLLSAGPDGEFGTDDDVASFSAGN